MALFVGLALPAPATAHGPGGSDVATIVDEAGERGEGARWLPGDHHIHSRYSVGWDDTTQPPTPLLGEDAIYPIPMNAVMARRYGLSWMVATDHGGPNHSKINHDHAYPELLESRAAVPEVIQFFGMEFDTPGADHSSIIVPAGDDEAARLQEIESGYNSREAWPRDETDNTETRMLAALRAMDAQQPKPVLFAHHPSRSAQALGHYGLTTPSELRSWNDTAPEVAIGMEGAPGHQAAAQAQQGLGPSLYDSYFGKSRPRGAYREFPTMGGFDQMTARLGGFWDSMLGEGRRWWITANSDSHVHWTEGGIDFWPGEYSKTYVFAESSHDSILAGLRAGRIFVTTGDLVSELDVTASAGGGVAMIGESLTVEKGQDVTVTIAFLDPETNNANGDNPAVARVDLIRGAVTGPANDKASDTNPTTRVEARFTADQWSREGAYSVIRTTINDLGNDEYIRVRGTNTQEAEPQPDVPNESPWTDLWFYSNPIFLETP